MAVFLAVQFLVPVVLWSAHHGQFTWKMFSRGPDVLRVETVDADGHATPVALRAISSPREEIRPAAWARAVCDFDGSAHRVRVVTRSGEVERRC